MYPEGGVFLDESASLTNIAVLASYTVIDRGERMTQWHSNITYASELSPLPDRQDRASDVFYYRGNQIYPEQSFPLCILSRAGKDIFAVLSKL